MKNIVLLVFDSCRADHLGCYGYRRNTSPYLDTLAQNSAFFKKAYAASSWTKVSMASILTGLIPKDHKVSTITDELEAPTIADRLKKMGFATACFTGIGHIHPSFGFSGFDEHKVFSEEPGELDGLVIGEVNAERMNDYARDWIESLDGKKPFFLYLHYADTHTPFKPPTPEFGDNPQFTDWEKQTLSPEEKKDVIDLYDSTILYSDRQTEKLVKWFEEKGLDEDTIFIITADHGELFMEENYFGHAQFLHEKLLHVPLFIYGKGLKPQTFNYSVSLVDLYYTILDCQGQKNEKSLFSVNRDRVCLSECHTNYCQKYAPDVILTSIIQGDLQVIRTKYDWVPDLKELKPLRLDHWYNILKHYSNLAVHSTKRGLKREKIKFHLMGGLKDHELGIEYRPDEETSKPKEREQEDKREAEKEELMKKLKTLGYV